MNIMKKLITAFALALLASSALAQSKIDLGSQTKGYLSGQSGINVTSGVSTWAVKEGQAFDLVYQFNGVSTYTNNTTEAKSTFGSAFNTLNDTTQFLYLGKSTAWSGISINFRSPTTTALTTLAQYWNGSAWTTLTITDGTNGLQSNGAITFTTPGDWATTAVNGQTYYWVRLAVSANPSTTPAIYSVRPGANTLFSATASNGDTNPALSVLQDGRTLLNNTIAVAPTVTYTVGLNTDRLGKQADFLCKGVADQTCINAAVAACAGNPCKIQLLAGTFNLTGSITPLQSNLEFVGMGPGKTIIKYGNVSTSTFFDVTTGTLASPLTNLTFRDFEIDRDADTKDGNISRKCIYIQHMRRVKIDNLYGHGSGATCIGIDYLDGAQITNSVFTNTGTSSTTTGNSGIGIGTGEYTSEPVIITNNIVTGAGLAGILLEAQAGTTVLTSNNQIVSNNIITGSGKYGVYNRGVSNVIISNNIIRGNTLDGVNIQDYAGGASANVTVANNLINGNSAWGINVNSTSSGAIYLRDNDLTANTSGAVTWAKPSATACTSPTVTNNTGPRGFTVNVGTTCAGISTIALAMPTANTGWICQASNVTNGATSAPRQTGAASTTGATITNFSATTGAAVAWADADVVRVSCQSY